MEEISAPRAILFDWDNTLVDTWPVIHESMNYTLTHMGEASWSMDETRLRVRRALREAFPEMFGDRWEEARDVFYERFHAIHLERLEIIDGADEVLKAVAESGVYCGVVSNKNGENLRREAEHLGWGGYFNRMVGATDAERDKPAIEPVLLALADSGVKPGKDVWFVGDTDIDMKCARNAGCLGVLIGEEAVKPAPDMMYPDLYAFTALVSGLEGSI